MVALMRDTSTMVTLDDETSNANDHIYKWPRTTESKKVASMKITKTSEWKLYNHVEVIHDVSLEDHDAVIILYTISGSYDGSTTN